MFSTIFSLSACLVFTAAILHVHFDSAILGLYLFYFVIPIRKSGLVSTFESEISDFSRQYFNFPVSKNRTMGAKCNRLIVHLAVDQQALMLVFFRTSLAIFITFFFKFHSLFLAFSKFSDLRILFFQTSLTHKPVLDPCIHEYLTGISFDIVNRFNVILIESIRCNSV